MKERFGAKSAETMKLRFHAQTGGATLTAQQIDNNVVRVTLQALAAVFGGCQSLHTNSRDEALALPTEDSATLALRTQQIIAFESGVTETVDPFGGSYAVEALTDRLESEAQKIIRTIDELGGAVRAIEQKFYQGRISESAYRYQRAIEEKEKTIVGLNAFETEARPQPELLRIDESAAARQIERLQSVRSGRSAPEAASALDAVGKAAAGTDNLMPHILRAVEAYATVGEISDTLRGVWGEYAE